VGVPDQEFQQIELPGGEIHTPAATLHLAGHQVDMQIAHTHAQGGVSPTAT